MALLNYKSSSNFDSVSKPVIVYLHGLFGSSSNFQSIAKLISDNYILLDCRNHGSSVHLPAMDYFILATDVIDTLAILNINNPIIIGHSMGGKTALQLSQMPDFAIAKLVILDISPLAYPENKNYYIKLIDCLLTFDLHNSAIRALINEKLTEIYGSQLASFFLTNLKFDQNYYWRINLNSIKANLDNLIGAVEIKNKIATSSLLIGGNKTDYLNLPIYEQIKDQFLNAEYHLIDAGHLLHIQQTDIVVALIKKFLLS